MSTIVFVNPPISLLQRYGHLAGMGNTLAPLGLLYLAAASRAKKFNVAIVEASNNFSYQDSVTEILTHHPDYVAITSTTVSIFNAAKLAHLIKERSPKTIIIIGGAHLSACPVETLQKFPAFDFGVIGEGEETLIELLREIESNGKLGEVPGIAFREANRIMLTSQRPLIVDLDKLPFPAWDILPNFPGGYYPAITKFRKLPAAYILTSRGCPYNCIFCSSAVFKKQCRFFSHNYISEMIRILYQNYGVREIAFEDDTLFLSKERLTRICEFILKHKFSLSWTCNSRADLVSLDMLKLMKRAGCWQIGFGIESGAQEILDFSRKNLSLEVIEKAVALARKTGIMCKGFFILGFPHETKKSIRQTIDFAKRIRLNDITVSFMTPFPGSELYQIASQYGEHDKDWQKMSMLNTVFIPFALKKEVLERSLKVFLREFYLRPKIIANYLLRMIGNPLYFKRIFKAIIPLFKILFINPGYPAKISPQRKQYAKNGPGRLYWDYRDKIISNNISQKAHLVLDAGCGEGITLEKLVKAFPDKSIRGIEIDKEKVQVCQNQGLAVTEANLLQLNTNFATVDCCILSEVIEHFQYPDALRVIKETFRILNKGGSLIIVFPNDLIFRIARIMTFMFKEAFSDSGHLYQWTPNLMKKELIAGGFKITKITNIPLGIWPLSLHCIITAHKPE